MATKLFQKANFSKITKKFLNLALKLTGAQTLHCLGDSHIENFKYVARKYVWLHTRFNFCIVQGATAMGLVNPNSKTDALNIFRTYLKSVPKNESLLFCLGEVDCGFLVWYRAQKYNSLVEEELNVSVRNYLEFLDFVRDQGFAKILVVSAPLPTILDRQNWGNVAILRGQIKATQKQRTNLTIKYNEILNEYCQKSGHDFIDLDQYLFDPKTSIIHDEFRHLDPMNHHLNEEATAKILVPYLHSYGYW